MTRDEVAAALGRIQAELDRRDAAHARDRAACRSLEDLAALRRAAAETDALRVEWYALLVTFRRYEHRLDGG